MSDIFYVWKNVIIQHYEMDYEFPKNYFNLNSWNFPLEIKNCEILCLRDSAKIEYHSQDFESQA